MSNYIIQSGDTLSQIASKFNVDMHELAEMNGIRDINKIYAGKTLKIEKPTIVGTLFDPEGRKPLKEKSIQEALSFFRKDPEPVKEVPKPVQTVPEPVKEVPEPVKEVPKTLLQKVPKPVLESSQKEQERVSIADKIINFFSSEEEEEETIQKPSLLSPSKKELDSSLIPSPVKMVTASFFDMVTSSLFDKESSTTFNAEDVGEDVVSIISEVGKRARAAGRMNASYEDYPPTERGLPVAALVGAARYADGRRIDSKTRKEYARLRSEMYPKNPIGLAKFVSDVATDPVLKAALTVGGFSIHGEEGNYSIKDRFNFNSKNKSKDDWYAWVRNKLSSSDLMPIGEDEGVRVEFKI